MMNGKGCEKIILVDAYTIQSVIEMMFGISPLLKKIIEFQYRLEVQVAESISDKFARMVMADTDHALW